MALGKAVTVKTRWGNQVQQRLTYAGAGSDTIAGVAGQVIQVLRFIVDSGHNGSFTLYTGSVAVGNILQLVPYDNATHGAERVYDYDSVPLLCAVGEGLVVATDQVSSCVVVYRHVIPSDYYL